MKSCCDDCIWLVGPEMPDHSYAFDLVSFSPQSIKGKECQSRKGNVELSSKLLLLIFLPRQRSNLMTDSKNFRFFKALFGGQASNDRGVVPLHIPLTLKMEQDPDQNVEAMWNQVLQQRLGPLLLLHAASRFLEKINPLPLGQEQRNRISNILLSEITDAVSSLFAHFFQQGGGIPETREQRDTISYAVRAVERLAINYKLLFRRDWADSTSSRTVRERTLLAALRIFECTRLEQLLLAFHYQKLPQHAWRDVNQLFFALRNDWDVKAKYPLKIQWRVEDSVSSVEMFPRTASLKQLYLAIQLTGLLDVISWPVNLSYRVGRYLSAVNEQFIKEDERIGDIPVGHCIIYNDQGGPPRFSREQDHGGASLLIDLNPLLHRATLDRLTLMPAAKTSVISTALKEIPEGDRLIFLDLILHNAQPRQRHEPRQRILDASHARLYGGFDVVYRLFCDVYRQDRDGGVVNEGRRFWDSLFEHINIISEGGHDVHEPRWIIADEGSGGIQLHVQEGDYGLPLYVGRLVAYNRSDGELTASRLGYVVRLQRLGDDEVEVAIARIRGEIRPVVVEDQDTMEQRPLPALLIRTKDGKLQILCDNKHRFITGDRLAVKQGGYRQNAALGDANIAQTDFSVFALHTSE